MADDPKLAAFNSQDIDDILDEIEHEQSQIRNKRNSNTSNQANTNWDDILHAIRNGNVNFIKNLITSRDIEINQKNPLNGMTLLMYSVIIGNIDLVKVICNFGANVKVCDDNGDDALKYAIKYGRYKITELIYYRQLSGSLGNDLRNIATQIHEKKKEAEEMKDFLFKSGGYRYSDNTNSALRDGIIQYMIKVMNERKTFGKDLLFYAWYFVVHDNENTNIRKNPLQSELWQSMMRTYEEIVSDTSDKNGWEWLKKYFVNSLIWYLPHPTNTNKEQHNDDMDTILKQTLFHELLIRIRSESKQQSNKLLKQKIDTIKLEKPNDWKQLISYNVDTKYSHNARQDICGCLIPKYNKYDLSEEKYPPSTHFSAQKHYDTNIYLSEIMFRANILDTMFQRDMKSITKEICLETGDEVIYRAGPVKTLTRSQTKVENDYINEDYPTSAKILDVNRCALQFNTMHQMMRFIATFTNKINKSAAKSIVAIIRCKNGWSVYNPDYPQYTDVKLNVLISSANNETIIAEIQLLLDLMSAFKKKAHKLYSVERHYELVYNFAKLQRELDKFGNNGNTGGVIINLAKNDDIKYFKKIWNTMGNSFTPLIDFNEKDVWKNPLLHIILKNGEINQYIKQEYWKDYRENMINWIKKYIKKHDDGWNGCKRLFNAISSAEDSNNTKDEILAKIVAQLFALLSDDKKRYVQLLQFNPHTFGATFINELLKSENKYVKSLALILNNNIISDREKFELLEMGKTGGWLSMFDEDILLKLLTKKLEDGNITIGELIDKNLKQRTDPNDTADDKIAEKLWNVFCTINNDITLSKLLSAKNSKFQTLADIQSVICHNKKAEAPATVKFEVEELIIEATDYVQLAKLLMENESNHNDTDPVRINTVFDGYGNYTTNPFLSAVLFGKETTIISLLNYVKRIDDKTGKNNDGLLKQLLLDNYDKISGNNCLMIAYENGFDNLIVKILQFLNGHSLNDLGVQLLSSPNRLNEETILIQLFKKESNINFIKTILDCIDNKAVIKLLNQTDIRNNSCLDYAQENLFNDMHQYLQH